MIIHISDLTLRIDLSETTRRLRQELAEIFKPFVTLEEAKSHELLHVVPVKTKRWKNMTHDRESLVNGILQEPLKKFPFTRDLQRDIGHLQKRLRPFAVTSQTDAFLSRARGTRGMQIYQLPRAWLIRRPSAGESVLFLKARSSRRLQAASIYGAAYFVASNALPLRGGLMLHGVGVSRFGLGLLFLGASGGGKTTVAQFAQPGSVISDDCVIAKRNRNNYFLTPSPFDQYLDSNHAEIKRLGIGLFLEKDENVCLRRIPASEACSRILMNYIHHFRYYPSEAVKESFRLVTGMCRQTPFYVLHFDKSPSFWHMIEDKLSASKPILEELAYGLKEQEKTTLRTPQGL